MEKKANVMGVIHVKYSFPYFGALHIAIIW